MPKTRTKQTKRRQHGRQTNTSKESNSGEETITDLKTDIMKFFVGTASIDQHYDAQNEDVSLYLAALVVLLDKGVEISQNARVRALAAAWARRDFELANTLLLNKDNFGLVEVLKAVTLLDSERMLRVEEKKLKMLIASASKVRPHKIGHIKSNVDNLKAVKPKVGSVSSAVCKHIRSWTRTLKKEELEFYALQLPKEPWTRLADICHFNPKADFPALPWFLQYCFGGSPHKDSIVHHFGQLSEANVNELIKEHPVPFCRVKKLQAKLTDESKRLIAEFDKLDQVLWYYEDLQCSAVDEVLQKRLMAGEVVSLSTGKLMERLLTIKMIREGIPQRVGYNQKVERTESPTKAAFIHHLIPQAQERLKNIRLTLDSPVVVMGDCSGSMEIAIRTSTIIASLLTAVCHAKLVFFSDKNMDAPFIPSTVEEALEMAVTIKTDGCTSPAASLWPFYSTKQVIKTIIMVTDEEENTVYENMRFAPMFKKYREEVSPGCRLVFVSFMRTQHATGKMIRELKDQDIEDGIIQFRFDQLRPDLTKLDRMIGLLSAGSSTFEEQVNKMKAEIDECGIMNKLKQLWIEDDAADNEGAQLADSHGGTETKSQMDVPVEAKEYKHDWYGGNHDPGTW